MAQQKNTIDTTVVENRIKQIMANAKETGSIPDSSKTYLAQYQELVGLMYGTTQKNENNDAMLLQIRQRPFNDVIDVSGK